MGYVDQFSVGCGRVDGIGVVVLEVYSAVAISVEVTPAHHFARCRKVLWYAAAAIRVILLQVRLDFGAAPRQLLQGAGRIKPSEDLSELTMSSSRLLNDEANLTGKASRVRY